MNWVIFPVLCYFFNQPSRIWVILEKIPPKEINPFFQPMFHFLCPLKTSQNLWVSDVFWGYRGGILVENGLNIFSSSLSTPSYQIYCRIPKPSLLKGDHYKKRVKVGVKLLNNCRSMISKCKKNPDITSQPHLSSDTLEIISHIKQAIRF